MKRTILFFAVAVASGTALADHWVNGHTRKDGTYVQGHMASDPDSSRSNNRSSQTNGGTQRDEYSLGGGATNKSNSSYGLYDNDRDGINNTYDPNPESKSNCTPGTYGC